MTNLRYVIDFDRFSAHFAEVRLEFVADTDNPSVWLPTWTAGSYLIREFAKHISGVFFVSNQSPEQSARATKIDKNRWELTGIKAGDTVLVSYEVYCYDLSVRTAFVDNTRIFGNFSSLLVIPTGLENAPADIWLYVPEAFVAQNKGSVLACGLKHREQIVNGTTIYQLETVSAFGSFDYPFEIGVQSYSEFNVTDKTGKNILHRFFVSGIHHTDMDRLCRDVQKICQTQVDWLGFAPFDDYTFMTFATQNSYGGLEHINSTALVTPRDDLPTALENRTPSENYQRFLGLCSHEYFHAWWVKSVRPDVMMTSQLQQEALTPLLWVFEGFTSYVDDFVLGASGVVGADNYLSLLAGQLTRYYNNHGRTKQPVAESSFDAWIKYYRPDENSNNSTTSYYNKGAVVALYLDFLLNQHSDGKYRLFDLIKDYAQLAKASDNGRFGMSSEHLYAKISEKLPNDVCQAFWQVAVNGTDELDFQDFFAKNGIAINHHIAQNTHWGAKLDKVAGGLKIINVPEHSPATQTGLSANDIIVAVNDLRATPELIGTLTALYTQGKIDTLTCRAFRDDRLLSFDMGVTDLTTPTLNANITLKVNDPQKFGAWLRF